MPDIAIARFLPDGDLDASFGEAGVQTLSFEGSLRPRDLDIDVAESGKIEVCCIIRADKIGYARLNEQGQLDTLPLGSPAQYEADGQGHTLPSSWAGRHRHG